MGQILTTRRNWIGATLAAGSALAFPGCRQTNDDPFKGGRFAGTLAFEDEGRSPLNTLLGDELDGRLFTDTSQFDREHPVTPTSEFYVRTRVSHLLDTRRAWSIRMAGAAPLTLDELNAQAAPQGVHLMECAGNTRAVHFGMIGAASWDGVPLGPLLDRARFGQGARILVSGFDEYSARPVTPSVPGASWIFSRRQIEAAGAFLAVRMNGQPLTADHGAPVRLFVPGWYGCACIKWVNEIAPVEETAEATSQMREYAARTGQDGTPERASEYQPATLDPAAMPVRIEKWLVNGKIRCKVTGIVWGGSGPAGHLQIRFRPDEPYVAVSGVWTPTHSPWGLWTHVWEPGAPGTYRIRLRLADSSIRTRRLDTGFYVRQVQV